MNIQTTLLSALTLAAGVLVTPTTHAAQLTGVVTQADGTRVMGAMITLKNADGYSETAYSNVDGSFRLHTSLQGELVLRARAHDFVDEQRTTTLPAAGTVQTAFTLNRNVDPATYSGALPASAHAATLQWQDRHLRQDFVSQCQFCHQIGNELTRRPRSESEWSSVIDRMHGYGALLTFEQEREFPRVLAQSFQGQPVTAVLTPDATPRLAQARYREWAFGGAANYVHDIELGSDGKFYGVDMGTDLIWILDPRTNAIESILLPPNELPLGGLFAGAVAPLGTFAARHGPHSIVEGPDGKLYTTNSLSTEIGVFDPKTRTFEFVPTGGDTIYPHTLRFAADGMLWFTFALSNQIGRMHIETRRIDVIDLPSNGFWRWLADAMLPTVLKVASWFPKSDLHVSLSHHKLSGQGHRVLNLPYGIDISPVDGSIWYTKLYAGYIGRVDPKTFEVEEFATPYRGPRRARFDKNGMLWIPSFDEGYLMTFDTRGKRWGKSYRLPTLAANQYETPYALNVNNAGDGHVWITSNLSDRIFRFDPEREIFTAYPSPTRVAFMRDVVFTPEGHVCSSNSNLPAGAIEGGRPSMLCIEPDAYR